MVAVALAALAIVESLSDTGMPQALIQRKNHITRKEAGAAWTLQVGRGLVLMLVLYLFSQPLASLFGIAEAASLIALASALPLARNAINPGFLLLQKDRNFRVIGISESAVSIVDVAMTFACIFGGLGAASVLLGTLTADSSRFALSWLFFRYPMTVNCRWSAIKDLGRYGRWIWGTSVLAVVLNQFDKVVIARWLGATQFGMYQTSSRVAQLAVADIAVALGGFLFPTMVQLHHASPKEAHAYFLKSLKRIGMICGGLSLGVITVGPKVLQLILGAAWHGTGPILQIQGISMWFGSLIAVCVAYLRAIGRPNVIAHATFVQLLVLVTPAYWVVQGYGAIGMAVLVTVGLASSLGVMIFQSKGK